MTKEKTNKLKEVGKFYISVFFLLFIADIGVLRLLPKLIAKCASFFGIILYSSDLTTKYSMGIIVRVFGLCLFWIIMKHKGFQLHFRWHFDKKVLLISWMFFAYIIMNIELVPLSNLRFLPVLLMMLESIIIGIYEETVFRGTLLSMFLEKYNASRKQIIGCVFATSALFGLFHFTNVLLGVDIVAVVEQVFYCFLLGVAFSALFLRTKGNVLWCGIIHGLFDMASGFGDFAEPLADTATSTDVNVPIYLYLLNVLSFVPIFLYGLYLLRAKAFDMAEKNKKCATKETCQYDSKYY